MTKASNQRMGKRNGSESNPHSKASPSDRQHDAKQVSEERSIKLGTGQGGKLKEPQGGTKR